MAYDPPKVLSYAPQAEGELRLQAGILEEMFADPGLSKLRARFPSHPAVRRYDNLQGYLEHGQRLTYPLEEPLVAEIAMMLMDRSTWAVSSSGGSFWSFITDDVTRAKIERRIWDPDGFEDTIAEVFFWSWLRSEGVEVKLIDHESMPDLVVHPTSEEPIYGEVKNLRLGTPAARATRVIEKANRQIKRADPAGAGIVFLRITREGYMASIGDRIPSDVQPFVDEVRAALRVGIYRSVAKVVVVWDEFTTAGTFPDRTSYFFNRRFEEIDHPEPRQRPVIAARFAGGGRSAAMRVIWSESSVAADRASLPPLKSRHAVVTQLFREHSEFAEGVRSSHAIGALMNPLALERHELGGQRAVLLATQRITLSQTPFTLIIDAHQDGDDAPQIMAGYRLYDKSPGDAELANSPFAAFLELLRRYGTPVRVGEQEALFIRSAQVPIADEQSIVEIRPPDGESGFFLGVVRIEEGDPCIAHVAWAYSILRGRYRAALAQHRS